MEKKQHYSCLMLRLLSEVTSTLRRNKLRTFLTGFAIAWGIFMLVILLAAGNGLKNGVMSNFQGRSKNKVTLYGGYISIPYQGKQKWTAIRFNEGDIEALQNHFQEIEEVLPSFFVWNKDIVNGRLKVVNSLVSATPALQEFESLEILQGRFINELDLTERRKVIVITEKDASLLFDDVSPLQQYVSCDGLMYQVVGIYKPRAYWRSNAYIPSTTLSQIYNPKKEMRELVFAVNGIETKEQSEAFNDKVRELMRYRHQFSPEDQEAVYVWDSISEYQQTMQIFFAISMFVWIIGIGTLIAGVVGVGNIMLITVRERTKEFGILKAIGAKPNVILRQVIFEALFITALFGYIGMASGIAVSEGINFVMSQMTPQGGGEGYQPQMFKNPTVDIGTAIAATLVLVLAGVLAGFFPAKKAVSIKPIEALRHE